MIHPVEAVFAQQISLTSPQVKFALLVILQITGMLILMLVYLALSILIGTTVKESAFAAQKDIPLIQIS